MVWFWKKRVSPNKRDMQRLEKEKSISAFLSCCLDSCKPSPLTEVKVKNTQQSSTPSWTSFTYLDFSSSSSSSIGPTNLRKQKRNSYRNPGFIVLDMAMVLVVSPVADSPAESMSCEMVRLSNQTKDLEIEGQCEQEKLLKGTNRPSIVWYKD